MIVLKVIYFSQIVIPLMAPNNTNDGSIGKAWGKFTIREGRVEFMDVDS